MPKYAEGTEVPADKSRLDIERTLQRYGASSFMYGWEGSRAVVMFAMKGRNVRFVLPMPDRSGQEFTLTPTGKARSANAAQQAYEQATRQRWRALLLVVKAKLEAVDCGITTFDQEFLANFILPDGRSVGDEVVPRLDQAYKDGGVPALLPGTGK